MAIEKGSMREAINSIYQILINDEVLLRLLWYLPKGVNNPDPLDPSLPNIKGSDIYWDIVTDRIMLKNKVSDLENNSLCRLYITSGRRRADGRNYLLSKQQILINTFVHEDYEGDMRSEWISDRIHKLIALERMKGMIGMLDYIKSDPYEAPIQYQRYVHVYEYTIDKKWCDSMSKIIYNKDFFIFGRPIETPFGKVRFLTYPEYLENQQDLVLISMNVLHFYYYYRKEMKNPTEEEMSHLKQLKESDLLSLVLTTQQILKAYVRVFENVITFDNGKEIADIFNSLDTFMDMRKLIMDMNILVEEDVSPNEEIQEGIERGKLISQTKSEKQSFEDIITSIVAGTSNSFDDVCNMTVYQVYATYARLGAIFNYNTSTLFATVSNEVEIEPWNKNINLLEKDDKDLKRSEFEKKYGKMF